MPGLPTGTIAFLFTDVEGSTRLWEAHPAAMRQVMARHAARLTAVFAQHDGAVVRPRGAGDLRLDAGRPAITIVASRLTRRALKPCSAMRS